MESLLEFSDFNQVSGGDKIPLAEFLSVAIHLAEESGKVIRQVRDSGNTGEKQKADNQGEVTEADLRVQKTIEENLKVLYPKLRVEGEEEKATTEGYEAAVKAGQLRKQFIRQEMLDERQQQRREFVEKVIMGTFKEDGASMQTFEEFSTEEAVVWVDPLDGTTDFCKGNYSAVTVLIGVAIKDVSRIGIVHKVFSDEDDKKSATFFGTMEHGVFRVDFDLTMTEEQLASRIPQYLPPFDHFEQPAEDKTVSVAASLMHFKPEMQAIIDKLAPVELKRLGGAGNKCFNIAYGVAETYVHPDFGLKFWDLCANEALIKGMGGYATDVFLQRLKYPLQKDTKVKGLILGRNPLVHELIVKRLGKTIEDVQAKFNK